MLIPIDSHGNVNDPGNFTGGTITTWVYTLDLLTAPTQDFSISGQYTAFGDGTVLDWTLTGVGTTVNLVAQGYIETTNSLVVDGGQSSFSIPVPGARAGTVYAAADGDGTISFFPVKEGKLVPNCRSAHRD